VTWAVALLAVGAVDLGGVRIDVNAFAQVDAVIYSQASLDELDPSTGAPLNENAIVLRRAHVRLEASRWLFGAAVELAANTVKGLNVRLFDAQVWARWPEVGAVPLVQLSAGLMRVPFGYDVQLPNRQRLFLEEATLARALFPGDFDLGIQLQGGWRALRWQLAVMNGEPVGERSLPGSDPNSAKDIVGRIGAVFFQYEHRVFFEGHVSGLTGTGFHAGAPSTKDTLVWRDANEDGLVQDTELQVLPGLPGTPSQNFRRYALGADVHASVAVPRLGQLDAVFELAWATNLDRGLLVSDPVAAGRLSRQLGWSLGVTQELPLGFAVGLRHDRYNPDADSASRQGAARVPYDATVATWAAIAAWRWRDFARVIAEYDHQTNALTTGANGAPATLGSDRFVLRLEVGF
jgi:hypothetical protein